MKLLDVNVWLAAAWAAHLHHDAAKAWFDEQDDELAWCRVTQLAFLRLLTNPAVMLRDAKTRSQAWETFEALARDPRVRVVQEPAGLLPLWVTFSKRPDRHHHLWTDDYLAAFARGLDAEFVTFERACVARYPSVRVVCLS